MRRILGRLPPPPRVGVVQGELDRFEAPRYLEIGVGDGTLFLHVRGREKVGVDPKPAISKGRWAIHRLRARNARLVRVTSDEFFDRWPARPDFDVAFIDGYHTSEQALRDIDGALARISPEGAVLVHDCSPPSEAAALRDSREALRRGSPMWCGDVWRAIVRLRATRSDLEVHTVDVDFGIGVVQRGRSEPLPLSTSDVEGLGYADLEDRRAELLGLMAPEP